MPIIRKMFREARAIDASKFAIDLVGQTVPASGIPVDQDTALTFGAAYACIRVNSETLASMPWDVVRIEGQDRIPTARPPKWLEQPNPENTPFEFKQRIQASLETDGNAYIQITAFDNLAFPSELWALHPSEIDPKRDTAGRKHFIWNGTDRFEPWNPARPALGQILHIKGHAPDNLKGLSPIDLAREAIGLGLVTERFGARFFGSGQNPSGVIEIPDGKNIGADFKKNIKETWNRTQGGIAKSHLPAILTGGAQWKPITISPENAQFLETRKHQVGEIARWFGVPPWVIGDVEKTTSWGTGIEQQFIGWKQLGLQPRATRLEQAFSTLTPTGEVVKINLMGLLRGDQKSRFESYAIALQNKWTVPNEVRHLEDQNSVPWGDEPIETPNPTGGATA